MKVDKLQIINFGGLSGKREYHFPEKLTALCMPNGSGKTSVLTALRTAVTGDTKGTAVYGDAPHYDVGVLFSDGTHVIREVSKVGPGKQWYNKKAIAVKELDRVLGQSFGIPVNTMKIVTASEVVAHMKPQELSEFMLSYIPETLDTQTVISYLTNPTDGMKEILTKTLPAGAFSVSELDRAYSVLFDQRKSVKKEKAEAEAAIKVLGSANAPAETKAELTGLLETIVKSKQEMAVYQSALDAYNKALAYNKKLEEATEALTKELAGIPDATYDDQKASELSSALTKLQNEMDDTKRLIVRLQSTVDSLNKAITTLNQPVCPLSERLVCTTDKSAIRADLESSLKETKEEIVLQKKKVEEIGKQIADKNAQVKSMNDAKLGAVRREAILKQLEQAKSSVQEAKEPKKPEVANTSYTEDDVRRKLRVLEDLEKAGQAKAKLSDISARLYDLESLVTEMAPKGPVKEKITGAYISAFEDAVNAKAAELKSGMKMRFALDGGITPLLDIAGDGTYLPYHLLSGGEKIYMIFLLLDMFNAMCGLRLLIIDELSVLDEVNFGSLLDLLQKHTEEYDQILISTVDHADLVAQLKKRSIPVIAAL